MKKKEFIRAVVLVVAIIIVVAIIKLIQGFDSTKNDLKKLGYTKDEINVIIEKLDEETIKKVLNLEYNEKLDEIIIQTYFIPSNLEKYLEYSKKQDNLEKVISLVNVGANEKFYTNTKETDDSKGNSMLVNKYHYLNSNYAPDDIVEISNWYAYSGHSTKEEVYTQYKKMWNAAKKQDLTLLVNSSYRTLEDQQKEYDLAGDEYASRPGFSEHQTGLALDIVTYDIMGNDFENTDEFKWLQNHAHEYGFILRYPKNKEDITGYSYESWHYRYLGEELATKVYESGLTYDEYYAYFCEYKNEC